MVQVVCVGRLKTVAIDVLRLVQGLVEICEVSRLLFALVVLTVCVLPKELVNLTDLLSVERNDVV